MLHPNAREFPSLMAFKKNLNPAQQSMIIDCVKHLYLGFVSFNFVPFSLFLPSLSTYVHTDSWP